ncbi:MAG: hypothetical protein DRP45_08745 [Candidatus Zixiibacteriota bacterium]|nr:MAG: hypothetical protein DRP45_08745 [candidate division Zixibacteria bacterium]
MVGLAAILCTGVQAQEIQVTPFYTDFFDTLYSSTLNGALMPAGTIIEAFDPDGILCGRKAVITAGGFGFMPVYGDDGETPGVDEGAVANDTITFKINGRLATVVTGDPIWNDLSGQNVQLSATSTVAITGITLPGAQVVAPGATITIPVEVRNDGDGLDFYSVNLSMSQPGGTGVNDWEAFEPDSFVYADPNEIVTVYFSIRAPLWAVDTLNVVSYSVYSNLDTTQKVESTVDIYRTITDVEDPSDPDGLPASFTVHQNYPNPFNPSTTIAFDLPTASTVRFEVYDILGRQVEGRELGMLGTGPHEIEFSGYNLSSGVYFYRVVTQSYAQSRKMILMK